MLLRPSTGLPSSGVWVLCSNTYLNLKSPQLLQQEVSGHPIHHPSPGRIQEQTHALGLKPYLLKAFTHCQQWSRGGPGIPSKGSEWGKFQASPNLLGSVNNSSRSPKHLLLPTTSQSLSTLSHQGLLSLEHRSPFMSVTIRSPRLPSHPSSHPLSSLFGSVHPLFCPHFPCFPNCWSLSTVSSGNHIHQQNFLYSQPPLYVLPSPSYSKGNLDLPCSHGFCYSPQMRLFTVPRGGVGVLLVPYRHFQTQRETLPLSLP